MGVYGRRLQRMDEKKLYEQRASFMSSLQSGNGKRHPLLDVDHQQYKQPSPPLQPKIKHPFRPAHCSRVLRAFLGGPERSHAYVRVAM